MRRISSAVLALCFLIAAAPSALAAVKFAKVQYESPGPDTGSNSSLNSEFVVIKNAGSSAISLRGWKLTDRRTAAEGGNVTFKFPRFRLGAGKTVKVHTGSGANTRSDLYWGRSTYTWGDDSDTAYLNKPSGRLADRCHWVSNSQQTSPPARC
jgi:hypothetical protein